MLESIDPGPAPSTPSEVYLAVAKERAEYRARVYDLELHRQAKIIRKALETGLFPRS